MRRMTFWWSIGIGIGIHVHGSFLERIVFLLLLLTPLPALSTFNQDAHYQFYKEAHTKLSYTAQLGQNCDINLYDTRIKPIYEKIKQGDIDEALRLQSELIGILGSDPVKRSHSCFGYTPHKLFKDYTGSLTNYYKCENQSVGPPRCVCLDEEPLAHEQVPPSNAFFPTGCRLKEPKLGDKCSRSRAEDLHKRQFKPVFGFFKDSQDEKDFRYSTEQWYGTDQYTMSMRQDFYAFRRPVCHNHKWSMECNAADECVCRIQEKTHFVFKPVNGDCVSTAGSVCTYLTGDNDVTMDNKCEGAGVPCDQIVYSMKTLRGCGGKKEWDKITAQNADKNDGSEHLATLHSISISIPLLAFLFQ